MDVKLTTMCRSPETKNQTWFGQAAFTVVAQFRANVLGTFFGNICKFMDPHIHEEMRVASCTPNKLNGTRTRAVRCVKSIVEQQSL